MLVIDYIKKHISDFIVGYLSNAAYQITDNGIEELFGTKEKKEFEATIRNDIDALKNQVDNLNFVIAQANAIYSDVIKQLQIQREKADNSSKLSIYITINGEVNIYTQNMNPCGIEDAVRTTIDGLVDTVTEDYVQNNMFIEDDCSETIELEESDYTQIIADASDTSSDYDTDIVKFIEHVIEIEDAIIKEKRGL